MFKSQQIQQISLESYRTRNSVQLDPIVISIAQVCEDAQVVEYNGQKLAIFSVGEHQYHCAFDHTILEHLHKYNIVVWGPAAERAAKMARVGAVVRIVGEYCVDYYEKDDDIYSSDYVLVNKIEYLYPKQLDEDPKDVIQQITDQIILNHSFHSLEDRILLLTYVDITSKSEIYGRHLEIDEFDI